jgi:integration host factor subunit beta
MLKSDLILSLNKKHRHLSINDIETVVDMFLNKLINSLQKGHNIEIRGFGTLSKKKNKAKFVRNPKTNEKIYKEETFKIHFKIGKILHKRINSLQ